MTSRKVASLAVAMLVAVAVVGLSPMPAGAATRSQARADMVLDRMLQRFVATKGGPPGAAVVVHRGAERTLHTAGVADVQTGEPIEIDDHMRIASVSKAFSGAASLSLVTDGRLSLNTTIGQLRPDLPPAWWPVTLRQLLNHTSGLPDYSESPDFAAAVAASLLVAPPPRHLLSFVQDEPLRFRPGSQYRYSNSDNITVGLMVEAATGQPYEQVLQERVYAPLGLTRTSLPRGADLPEPFIHGYLLDPLVDVSEVAAAGWAWASGGIVSTPADIDRFIRGYAAGRMTNPATRAAQFRFVEGGHSVPPGPGRNAAGLGIFRYQTRCGTVYGHTGTIFGFTQFAAATADGSRSATLSINNQIIPERDLRNLAIFREVATLAVCAALA